jgi:vacuolar-type H+-ATPase subunit F/Vma7
MPPPNDEPLGFMAKYLPTVIGWVLAGVSTFTLVSVKVASLEQTRNDHERRILLTEAEVGKIREQIGNIQLDVRESTVILRSLAKERGIDTR